MASTASTQKQEFFQLDKSIKPMKWVIKRTHRLPLLTAALVFTTGSAYSATPTGSLLEDRVARIERIMENQSAAGIMLQLQQMQQETQEPRGLIETQQLELQRLQRQLRDQYLDIDSRITASKGPETSSDPMTGNGKVLPSSTNTGSVIDVSGTDLPPTDGTVTPEMTVPQPSSPQAIGIPSLPTPETTVGNEKDSYRNAFDLLKQRKYPESIDSFNALLRQFPQGQFADNARYWLAETYYVQRNYPAALAEFDRLVQLHPTSSKVPGSLLKIGYIHYEQEAYDQARTALRQVITKYPKSPEARLAQSRLTKIDQIGR